MNSVHFFSNPSRLVVFMNSEPTIKVSTISHLSSVGSWAKQIRLRYSNALGNMLLCSVVRVTIILYQKYLIKTKQNKTKQKTLLFFFPKPSLGAHTVHGLSFGLRTPLMPT